MLRLKLLFDIQAEMPDRQLYILSGAQREVMAAEINMGKSLAFKGMEMNKEGGIHRRRRSA